MGKSGDLLRRKKLNNVRYTFTRAELEDHDMRVRHEYRAACDQVIAQRIREYEAEMRRKSEDVVRKEWDERQKEFLAGDFGYNFLAAIQTLLCLSAEVLVEDFHWKPIPKKGYVGRYRLTRFCEGIIRRLNEIEADDKEDIRKYADKVWQKCGVKFEMEASE